MNSNKRWNVQLGDEYWGRFTYARPPGDPFRLLGSIARGAQIGALAEAPDGRYVQVNGDHVTPLSDSQVRRAVAAARLAAPPQRPRRVEPSHAVVVTVKRRRTFTPA
jgi:hypothetical protein